MQYTVEVVINVPRDKVIELFDSTENLKEWQPGLISFEHISGEVGEVGAKSHLVYKMGKRDYEMTETITAKNFPMEFSGTYEGPGMWNSVQNLFEIVDDNTTRWVSNNEFRGETFMMKAMLFLMPGAFKKESLKFMNNFKEYAERGH